LEWTCRCFCDTTVTAIFLGAQSGAIDDIAGAVAPHATLIKGAFGVPVFLFLANYRQIFTFLKTLVTNEKEKGGGFSFKMA
jgi:hypothetical protein